MTRRTKSQKRAYRIEQFKIRKAREIQDLRAKGLLSQVKGKGNTNNLQGLETQKNSVMYLKSKSGKKIRKATPVGLKIYTREQFFTAFRVLNKITSNPYDLM